MTNWIVAGSTVIYTVLTLILIVQNRGIWKNSARARMSAYFSLDRGSFLHINFLNVGNEVAENLVITTNSNFSIKSQNGFRKAVEYLPILKHGCPHFPPRHTERYYVGPRREVYSDTARDEIDEEVTLKFEYRSNGSRYVDNVTLNIFTPMGDSYAPHPLVDPLNGIVRAIGRVGQPNRSS